MGITKNFDKLGVCVLIIIAIAILSSGCTSKSEITLNETSVRVPVPTITPAHTAAPTPEMPKVVKLKIMSVTTEPATLGGIKVIMKVKNIGDATAKDVYAGGINMQHYNPISFQNYPDKDALIYRSVQDVLINNSSYIDTGFVYNRTYAFAFK
jgi:ABC-type Fe3+-hydroxamate transport system substrate-binding protein